MKTEKDIIYPESCGTCIHNDLEDASEVVYWCSKCVHSDEAEDNYTPITIPETKKYDN